MVTYMKDSGKMIKLMGMVSLWMLMELCMKGSGSMINNMVKVLRHGIRVLQNIKDSSLKERRMEKVGLNGMMVAIMKETLWMDSLKDMENITLQI